MQWNAFCSIRERQARSKKLLKRAKLEERTQKRNLKLQNFKTQIENQIQIRFR